MPNSPLSRKTEGQLREQLAAYFLCAPPVERQTPAQNHRYRQAVQMLFRLEQKSVLREAGFPRPFLAGDMAGTLRAVLEAATVFYPQLQLMSMPPHSLCASFHPRILQLAVVGLLRASCESNRESPVTAALSLHAHGVALTISGKHPPHSRTALAVAKEAARLHGGSIAGCAGTIGLSFNTESAGAVGLYEETTAAALLRDTLSAVRLGFS